jgi:ADP-ribosylglycohydrolase
MPIDDSQLGSVCRRSDRIAGCFVGLAVGDALGAPLEFQSRRQVRNQYPEGLRDMIDSSLWKKGEYTDDTQMALLIAESLLQSKGFTGIRSCPAIPDLGENGQGRRHPDEGRGQHGWLRPRSGGMFIAVPRESS